MQQRRLSLRASAATILLATLAVGAASAGGGPSAPRRFDSYCALIEAAPRLPAGTLVSLRAVWTMGFEHSALGAPDCPKAPAAWLELAEPGQRCPAMAKRLEAIGPEVKAASATFEGRLYGGGGHGHLGAWPYKLLVSCLDGVEVVDSTVR